MCFNKVDDDLATVGVFIVAARVLVTKVAKVEVVLLFDVLVAEAIVLDVVLVVVVDVAGETVDDFDDEEDAA